MMFHLVTIALFILPLSHLVADEIALFKKWPALKASIERIQILNGPTTLKPMHGLEQFLLDQVNNKQISGGQLLIKKDDLSDYPLGGNKLRKYEFILGKILKSDVKTIITSGMYGSNHALATSLVGKRYNLKPILILGPQPITENVKMKLLSFYALGAELHYHESIESMGAELFYYSVESMFPSNQEYLIPTGGSSNLGQLGYVNAFFELLEQTGLNDLPQNIVLPVGSGGTAAGLLVGSCMSGQYEKVKIHGVGVSNQIEASGFVVRLMAQYLYQFIREHLGVQDQLKLPLCDFLSSQKAFTFTTKYFPPEYGGANEKVYQAMNLIKKLEGVTLDSTYSGKAMVYFIDYVKSMLQKNKKLEKTLFWLTYNSYDLNKIINQFDWKNPEQKWRELPVDFWKFFDEQNAY